MHCVATSQRTGRQCGRHVRPGDRFCFIHAENGRRGRSAAGTGVTPRSMEEVAIDLERLARARGMGDEILLLRAQIRRASEEGDWEAMRRGIETLAKALRVEHFVEGESSESLSGALSRVLEEVGNELGMTL